MPPMRRLGLYLTFLLAPLLPLVAQDLDIEPLEHDYGTVIAGESVRVEVLLANRGEQRRSLILSSSCPCVTVRPRSVELAAGESRSVAITFDTTEYFGQVRKVVLVESAAGELVEMIRLAGWIRERPSADSQVEECTPCLEVLRRVSGVDAPTSLQIELYMDVGCLTCRELADDELPALAAERGRRVSITEHDILDPEVTDALLERLGNRGLSEFPVAFVDGRIFEGEAQIRDGVEAILSGDSPPPEAGGPGNARDSLGVSLDSISILPVILAGLVDGINPCAFSTILFLISMLAITGRSRRETLIVGIVFGAVVFAGYFATGLGLLASVRALLVFPAITRAVRYLLVIVLTALAALSVRDAWLARQGRTREMTLQLSDKMKRRVHSVVRERVRIGGIIVGTAMIGVLVTIFEFSCTGQVYLPVIMHVARGGDRARGVALLLAYNAAFILPLVAVFAAGYAGVSMRKLSDFFSRHIAAVKLLLALVFAGLAAMTLLI